MKLVIVESPAKCKTIKRYLGDEYEVVASLGHIRDLSTSGKGGLGVDIEHDFKPNYIITKDKVKVVNDLISLSSKADEVFLATDPDREGEAISWHLADVLGLDITKTKRLEFHEITRESITHAIENPRLIDKNLVESQEARRILDRIIGFNLSSLLNRKIKSRSAGRVQSATLKLIKEHDAEIAKFVPEEYWLLTSKIHIGDKDLSLSFIGKDGEETKITNEKQAKEIFKNLGEKLQVVDIKESVRTTDSKEPFTTSTMQQEAFSRLKFKTKKTQSIAQKLYEGINVGNEHMGLITYMRTDSSRLSPTFVARAQQYIVERFGEEYLGSTKGGKHKELAQDAHEAIRPSSNHRTPESVKPYLTHEQYALYKLIYDRALASLMKPKKTRVLTVTLKSQNGYTFKTELSHTLFKGFTALYAEEASEIVEVNSFPDIKTDDFFEFIEKNIEQKFTQPPAHYTEAKLVKMMEEVGIGRPSTYASTIETIRNRKYVLDEQGVLSITAQGRKTIHVLEKYFPDIVDVKYTAAMEKKLDNVQEGNSSRLKTLENFYEPFSKELESAKTLMYVDPNPPTGELCPECGAPLVYKESKNGTFIGCSNYPKCKYIQKEQKEVVFVGRKCPQCGKDLVERTDNKGNKFVACSGFPKCKYIENQDKPIEYTDKDFVKDCPDCGGHLVKKKGKYGFFLGCTNYPTCKHMEPFKKSKRK